MSIHKVNERIYGKNPAYGKNRKLSKHEILLRKDFFRHTPTSSHCPKSWSEDVYILLKKIDKKYGFVYEYYNEKILTDERISNVKDFFSVLFNELLIDPILVKLNIKESKYLNKMNNRKPEEIDLEKATEKEITKYNALSARYNKINKDNELAEILSRKNSFRKVWSILLKELPKYRKNIYSKFFRKTPIVLGQFKEKFGYVTFYKQVCSEDPEVRDLISKDIENMIIELEVTLSEKNVYFELDKLSNEHRKVISDRKKKNFLKSL